VIKSVQLLQVLVPVAEMTHRIIRVRGVTVHQNLGSLDDSTQCFNSSHYCDFFCIILCGLKNVTLIKWDSL